MVTAAKPKQHSHSFHVENMGKGVARGTCKCGEIREYSGYGKEATAKVIQVGDPGYKDEKRKAIIEDRTDEIIAELTGSVAKPAENIPENIPEKPIGTVAVRKWINDNKDAILIDLATIGEAKTRRKWNIKATAMRNAKIRWGIHEAGKRTQKRLSSTEKAEPSTEKPETVTEKTEPSTQKAEPLGNFADTMDDRLGTPSADPKPATDLAISIELSWEIVNSLDDEEFDRMWAALGVVFQVYGRKGMGARA